MTKQREILINTTSIKSSASTDLKLVVVSDPIQTSLISAVPINLSRLRIRLNLYKKSKCKLRKTNTTCCYHLPYGSKFRGVRGDLH